MSAGSNIVGSAETGVAQASAAAQTAASEVNNSVQEIADNLKSNLPGYYSPLSKNFPRNLQPMPGIESKALGGYQSIARWSISAYILGLVSSFASIVFGITVVATSSGRILLVTSHLMATVFVTAATISTTVIYGLMAGATKAALQDFGIFASFGARTFTTACSQND
ncbi:hypothetical protein N7535_002903 [Penicillium sp. DV-2018c]|nr:hypothetical protein N7461_001411 [Penicillium sp. DV-2018c]KAJ5575977.1 hypothetical protein N7535_002903 [Penicillium sp. DV-2018c]